ncbi:MAG: DUF3887 domain-containing protein [Halobacterium sp.]
MPSGLRDAGTETRRRVLQSVGAAAVAALAGCAGEGGGDGTDTATASTPSATTQPTQSTTEPATQTTTVDPDVQREAALELVRALTDGEYQASFDMLAERVRSQYSASRLQSDWEGTTGDFGRFERVVGVHRTTAQGYDVLLVRAQFEAGLVVVQVVFDGASIEGLRFSVPQSAYSPPSYADESAFAEREVTLDSPACGLGATITGPSEGGDTGVVLVHGSGPYDRDETIGPNKPFRDLAWGLATEGVTVLRYDKRTHACDVATDELGFGALVVDDALTALDRLRAETGVADAAVVGHSLGAYAAPRIAARDGDADAFMLAAPSRPLYELVPDQVEYLARLDGNVTDAERERVQNAEATAQRLANGEYEGGGFAWGASFWRDVADYDPVATASSLSAAAYALQGGRDYQVTAEADFPAWVDALGDDHTELYDALNHLFVAGEGEATPSEYYTPGNVAEPVVSDLAGWLTA